MFAGLFSYWLSFFLMDDLRQPRCGLFLSGRVIQSGGNFVKPHFELIGITIESNITLNKACDLDSDGF